MEVQSLLEKKGLTRREIGKWSETDLQMTDRKPFRPLETMARSSFEFLNVAEAQGQLTQAL